MGILQSQDRESRYCNEVEAHALSDIQALTMAHFDEGDDACEKLLRRLWKANIPNGEPFQRVSMKWKEMGFQNSDPRKDVRGGGQLCLENMCYMSEVHPKTMKYLVCERAKRWENRADGSTSFPNYPIAAAGINITRMLCALLKLVTPSGAAEAFTEIELPFWSVIHSLKDFHELFCFTFQLLDRNWVSMNANYMMFNSVLTATREELLGLLTDLPPYTGVEWLRYRSHLHSLDSADSRYNKTVH